MINRFIRNFPYIENCWDTLKQCSIDKSKDKDGIVTYLSQSKYLALNYDKIKDAYVQLFKQRNICLCSIDAILELNHTLYWIEFKNTTISKTISREIKRKASDSILIFLDINNVKLQYVHNNSEFILVYNQHSNVGKLEAEERDKNNKQGLSSITNHIVEKANTRLIHFGLTPLEGIHFRKVHTLSEHEFENFCKEHKIFY